MSTSDASAGHYRKLERIGAGGMGVVWKAEDTKLGRIVALKFLAPELTRDPASKVRFLREARSASLLEHPNICTIFDVGEGDDGETFIAMPYYEGKTVKELIASGPLPLDDVLSIGAQIARGLAKAHAGGIVHRDIKPANLFVTTDNVSKILDFGLAKLIDATSITRPNTALGTLAYMAPEQLTGAEAEPAADLWSLGVVLFEMLTGRHPFAGENAGPISAAILHGEVPSLSALRPGIPPEAAALVTRLLQKDPAQRISSATEVATSLETLHQQSNATANVYADSAAVTRMQSGGASAAGRTRRRAGIAAAAAFIGLIAVAAVWVASRDSEEKAAKGAAPPAAVPAPLFQRIAVLPIVDRDPATEHVSDGLTRNLIDELSAAPTLRVTAPTSAFRFKGTDTTPGEIARQLDVTQLLTGELAKDGNQFRLRMEMIAAKDGAQVWGREYLHPASDPLGLQRRLAADATLRLGVTRADRPPETDSAEAYDLYLRGRFFWSLRGRENVMRAADVLEQAVRVDPDFARAWAGLGNAYGTIAGNRYIPGSTEEFHRKAAAAVDKALALDPTIAEAWASRGASKTTYTFDFEGAERDYKRAIELNPSYATAHQWYAQLLRALDRHDEARAELTLAQQLDPYSPAVNVGICFDRFRRREYREALSEAERMKERDPALWPGTCVYWSQILLGDFDVALASIRRMNPTIATEAEAAMQARGPRGLFETQLKYWVTAHYGRAMSYAMMGDADAAFAELDKAYQNRGANFEEFYSDPRFDAIRDDPRFDELARKVGLPQAKIPSR